MIGFQNVSRNFPDPRGGTIHAVDSLSLDVETGETVCLIGTSGSGKTTALRMVNRLIEPTSGTVQVGGRDVREQDPIALRRRVGYVIQTAGLLPHLTVARNVGLLCRLERWDSDRISARIEELLELVNLNPSIYAERFPDELSGGQRQRVGLARALALDPPILLMDEPFAAVDPITREELHREFLELESKVRKTVLLVTHDLSEAFALGDRIALMDNGRLVQVGSREDFRHRPATPFVRAFVRSHFGRESSP